MAQGVKVLGINTLLSGESVQIVKQSYVNPTGTTYPVLLSGNQVGAEYGTTKEDYLVIDGSGVCTYRVKNYNQAAVENALNEALAATDVPGEQTTQPQDFNLEQNYPNPFNSQTAIKFQLNNQTSQRVAIKIYDLQGREVRVLVNQNLASGSYTLEWDGLNGKKEQVTSGVFYYLLQVGDKKEIKKMTLLR
jgi:hypothetical protein